jgi:hypothetical protein
VHDSAREQCGDGGDEEHGSETGRETELFPRAIGNAGLVNGQFGVCRRQKIVYRFRCCLDRRRHHALEKGGEIRG